MGEHIVIDKRVKVIGRDIIGTIAYIGNTQFATGQWLGLTLDTPNGNNDGSVRGISYFSANEKHGMFVRTSQITLLDENPPTKTEVWEDMTDHDEEKVVEDLIPITTSSIIPPPQEFADNPTESPVISNLKISVPSPPRIFDHVSEFCFCCSQIVSNPDNSSSLEPTLVINSIPIKTNIDAASNIESDKTSDEGMDIAENNKVETTSGKNDDQGSLDKEYDDQKS